MARRTHCVSTGVSMCGLRTRPPSSITLTRVSWARGCPPPFPPTLCLRSSAASSGRLVMKLVW
eukprot:9486093-Pyramimonas_sp.AAC.1